MEIAEVTGLTLYGYTAEPGSPSEEALRLLASWTATERRHGRQGSAATPRDTDDAR